MGQIWAVARNFILETVRIRSLVIFVLLVLGTLTVGFAFWLHQGSGLGDQKVQTFLSHSLRFSFNFLSFLTIFLSVATISRDIKRREIFTIVTKPIGRGQFYLGKLLGISLLNLILLGVMGIAIYATAWQLARTEIKTEAERARLHDLVWTARRTVRPTVYGVDEKELEEKARQEADKEIAENLQKYETREAAAVEEKRQILRAKKITELKNQRRSAPPSGSVTFAFEGIELPDRTNGKVYIRYYQDVNPTPPDYSLVNEWYFGPHPDVLLTEQPFRNYGEIRKVHDFPIEAAKVSENGELYVTYKNISGPITVTYKLPTRLQKVHGIEALYVGGSFESNFLRGLLSMFLRLLFLGMLGVAAGGYLSLPVGLLLVLMVFIMGLSSGFLVEAINWQLATTREMTSVSKIIMLMFPQFGTYDPVPLIERGKMVEYSILGKCLFIMLFIKGGVAVFVGYLLFRFRELARVIV
jgi:hypothetical protein